MWTLWTKRSWPWFEETGRTADWDVRQYVVIVITVRVLVSDSDTGRRPRAWGPGCSLWACCMPACVDEDRQNVRSVWTVTGTPAVTRASELFSSFFSNAPSLFPFGRSCSMLCGQIYSFSLCWMWKSLSGVDVLSTKRLPTFQKLKTERWDNVTENFTCINSYISLCP